jgi:hypothetical protein
VFIGKQLKLAQANAQNTKHLFAAVGGDPVNDAVSGVHLGETEARCDNSAFGWDKSRTLQTQKCSRRSGCRGSVENSTLFASRASSDELTYVNKRNIWKQTSAGPRTNQGLITCSLDKTFDALTLDSAFIGMIWVRAQATRMSNEMNTQ